MEIIGQHLPLSVSNSGKYLLPLLPSTAILNKVSTKQLELVLTATCPKSKDEIAEKLHRQFTYSPSERLIRMLKISGLQWANDTQFFKESGKLEKTCNTCLQYQRANPRPVVSLPRASRFNKKVPMDIKVYKA